MTLSFFPREDKHDSPFCRSSDLLQSAMPSRLYKAVACGMKADIIAKFTAAGLFRICT